MKPPDGEEGGELTQLGNFFDTLTLQGLDKEGLSKRFPHVPIANGEFDIGAHIYDSFMFTRLSDIVTAGNYEKRQLEMFIEGYLDGIFVTTRAMLAAAGITIDAQTGLSLSNAFVNLKEDLAEVLMLYNVGTSTMKTLEIMRTRAGGLT